MTDIFTTAPISIPRFGLPRPSLPTIGICASLAAIARLIGDALNLAYVDPYAGGRQQPASYDGDLDGRDPNW